MKLTNDFKFKRKETSVGHVTMFTFRVLNDFVDFRCSSGALWRGSTTSLTIAYMDLMLASGKKGNNFVVDEDVWLCHSFNDSQDLIIRNGWKNNAFWDWIFDQYNQNCLIGIVKMLMRVWIWLKEPIGLLYKRTLNIF